MDYVKKYEDFVEEHGINKTWTDFFNFCKIKDRNPKIISEIKNKVTEVYPPPYGRKKK